MIGAWRGVHRRRIVAKLDALRDEELHERGGLRFDERPTGDLVAADAGHRAVDDAAVAHGDGEVDEVR